MQRHRLCLYVGRGRERKLFFAFALASPAACPRGVCGGAVEHAAQQTARAQGAVDRSSSPGIVTGGMSSRAPDIYIEGTGLDNAAAVESDTAAHAAFSTRQTMTQALTACNKTMSEHHPKTNRSSRGAERWRRAKRRLCGLWMRFVDLQPGHSHLLPRTHLWRPPAVLAGSAATSLSCWLCCCCCGGYDVCALCCCWCARCDALCFVCACCKVVPRSMQTCTARNICGDV